MFDFNKKTCIIESVGILIMENRSGFHRLLTKMPDDPPVVSFSKSMWEESRIRVDQ